jgi:hypothetical protein
MDDLVQSNGDLLDLDGVRGGSEGANDVVSSGRVIVDRTVTAGSLAARARMVIRYAHAP